MEDLTLKTIVKSLLASSVGFTTSQLNSERALALDFYYGRPLGNEAPGRSSVIITEVADVVGWILPMLMKTFASTEDVVRFDAINRADEATVDIESETINNIFYKQNKGFLVLHNWFWDALVQKNGYVKVFWDDSVTKRKEVYLGLDEDGLMQVMSDEELEPISKMEHTTTVQQQDESGQTVQTQQALYDVEFMRTTPDGKVKVINIPPEEILISPKSDSIFPSEARFIAHHTKMTRSALVQMGFDPDTVAKLPKYSSYNRTPEYMARSTLYNESDFHNQDTSDKSMEEVEVDECYLWVDFDEDGISELRKVIVSGDYILDNEEVDAIPFCCLCPYIIPHRHHGQSVADLVMDLQEMSSSVARNVLDNFYFTNNHKTVINDNVNQNDLAEDYPGSYIRTAGMPAQDYMPVAIQSIAQNGLSMLEWIESITEKRTGVSRNMQGLNDEVAGDTAHGTERVMSAAEQKVDLVARVFAETGIKDLFLKIHALIRKHGHATEMKLKNGWHNIDPTEWIERNSMTIKVGLGSGDRTKTQAALTQISGIQTSLLQSGLPPGVLITPDNLYAAAVDFARASSLPTPDAYFNDPKSPEAQKILSTPPPPDPNVEFMKMQTEIEHLKAQIKAQEALLKHNYEQTKLETEHDIRSAEIERKYTEMEQKNSQKMTELELKYLKNVPGSAV